MINTRLKNAGVASSYTLVVVLIAIALAGAAGWYLLTGNNIGIELGQTAPNFTITDIDGTTFSLSDHRGNVVIMVLMATWCGPCVRQMGHLKQVFDNYGGRGVVIMSIGVDPGEGNDVIRQFKASHGDNWIFARGPDVGVTYGVVRIPTLYIIDRQGRIAYKNVGGTPFSTLAAEIDKLSPTSQVRNPNLGCC